MNIIRTATVELTQIPAIAYKQKLSTGGSGIKIHRLDQDAVAVYTLDRRTGEGVPYGKVDAALFPPKALQQAIEALSGLPYSMRGKIKITMTETADSEDVADEAAPERIEMTGSPEYQALSIQYTDDRGKVDFRRMNKDFIQFAAKSKTVQELVDKGTAIEEILRFVIQNRAAYFAQQKEFLPADQADALIETLDEIEPRSAFKELRAHIKRMMAKR